jgi:hypothetical protein
VPLEHAVIALLFVLLEQRILGDVDIPELHVQLAVDRLEVDRLVVLDQVQAELVDVWQLVALRIDAPVVRTA